MSCTHRDQLVVVDPPERIEGCEECLAIGDSSPNQHASKHAHANEHPVLRSVERGEGWSWCVIDEVMFAVAR